MSLYYNNNAGVLLPVSGLNGQSGELVVGTTTVKTVSQAYTVGAGGTAKYTVTFDTPFSDANYILGYPKHNSNNSHITYQVINKTADGFTFFVTNPYSALLADTVTWTAFELYTASDVATLQDDVATLKTVTNTTVAVPGGGIRLYKCGRIVQASFQIVGDSLASNFTTGSWVNYGSSGIIPSAYRPITTVYCGQQIVETPVLMRVTTGGNLDYYYSGANIGYEYEWTQTWISAK